MISNEKTTIGAVLSAPVRWLAEAIDIPMRWWQGIAGRPGMISFFLIPNLLIFGMFVLVPLFINIVYSVTGGTELFLSDRSYVGGAHFNRLLECENHFNPNSCREDLFWIALWNTIKFVFTQVSVMIVFAVITALILNGKIRARAFWRAVFFFPVLLSPVVVGLIWQWMLQRQGVFNFILFQFDAQAINWLTERTWAFGAAVGVSIWAHVGFYVLILLAGLQAIPRDLYEAAEMDGTPPARAFWRITLPLLWPNLLVVIVLALIRAVQVFDEVYVLTGGGPGTSNLYLTQYIYEVGFASILRNPGLASAASLIMASILVVLTLAQLGLTRWKDKK
ncbi:carbohydrate ABC transporter permease [Actibacterium lipolyticum]|uniref:Lactose transport system permease protein LacF n=1 Tax=Actibacterium lipolyticum TaxID=1524263 RepID=A0A238L7X5_9RHOB|nr:sugar ABC transporter permease [Actibacterium lipolyticum]SMX51107.1 Lactose transport system permease protein LacF [Actibacterium lipolyticum]